MAALNEKLLDEVLSLSEEMRAKLVDKILESLNLNSDEDVDKAWEKEITRRIEEVERGEAELLSEEQVFSEMDKMLKK